MASEHSVRAPRQPLVPPGGSEVHARDMTATFAADVTLEEAQRQLAAVGQWLPIDGAPDATLGELVEQNSTGPLRLGYGAWRDLLLGAQFTNGRGELITAGGRVVKNVAGYDLTKFIIGSGGMFGRLVTITARTWLRPVGALIARHVPDVRIVNRLMPTPLKPHWALLTHDALWLGYLGDEATHAYCRSSIAQSEPLEWRERTVVEDIADRAERWRADGPVAFRASVPPMRIAEFAASLISTDWIADAAFGIVLGGNLEEAHVSRIRAAAEAVGSAVRFQQYDETGRGRLLDISTNPVERQIIERLKAAFDPDGVLNPLPWQSR